MFFQLQGKQLLNVFNFLFTCLGLHSQWSYQFCDFTCNLVTNYKWLQFEWLKIICLRNVMLLYVQFPGFAFDCSIELILVISHYVGLRYSGLKVVQALWKICLYHSHLQSGKGSVPASLFLKKLYFIAGSLLYQTTNILWDTRAVSRCCL